MGAENPTGTDTKVETERPEPSDQPPPPPPDRPGSPGQPSRLESRAAAQSPPEAEEREAPPLTRSARAERSTDPNDDPNRVGTPRADSRREAAERDGRTSHQEPPREQQGSGEDSKLGKPQRETQPPQVSTTEAEQPTADRETERREEPPTPGDGEEPDHRTPEHGVEDREKPETRPADETRPEPDDEFSPAPDASATGEPAAADAPRVEDDVPLLDHDMPEPDVQDREGAADGSATSDIDREAEVPLLDQRAPESDAEAGERIDDGRTDLGRENAPSPEPSEGERPVRPGQETTEDIEPVADDQRHAMPENDSSDGTAGDEQDRGGNTESPPPEETRDQFANLPTRADLDPVGAGVWLPDRGELDPVNENQDLREPDPEREPSWKRALRRLDDNLEEAQKNLSDYSKNAQEALGHRPPGDFPTSSRPSKDEFRPPDNTVNAPSAGLGVVALASIVYSLTRATGNAVNDMRRRRSDDN